ncbi:hypothetical protein E2562_025298 [Oryza meyeriana var. granulata]|uniref:BHLH domain-containing protein n=1 Tax=Oryza meyeriana var. granulata TaxID=110450 RepID=A0A6G1EP89_9ORYZ|nr:hypothetical protein E2562_025298 [Oryza meyeriana var. granulata]
MVSHIITNNNCCDAAVATATVAPRRRLLPSAVKNAGSKERRRIKRCVEVRRKMEALRSLMPGAGAGEVAEDGVRLNVEELLFRAADYITRLQLQVKMMQLMVDVLEHMKD